jgi:hypothetical protein
MFQLFASYVSVHLSTEALCLLPTCHQLALVGGQPGEPKSHISHIIPMKVAFFLVSIP